MRVFEFSGPGDGSVISDNAERPVPSPGEGQVQVEVAYAGLNFTDVLARRGIQAYVTGWPFVPGMEVGGRVTAVGGGVSNVAVGDRVVAFVPDGGGFAEVALTDAALTTRVPDSVDLAAATAIPLVWTTAHGLLRHAHVTAADSVLVTSAAGGVGSALAALLARLGVTKAVGGYGSVGKEKSLASVYAPALRDASFYQTAVQTNGGDFDVILDSVGGEVLAAAPEHLAIAGRLVSYGTAAGQDDPALPAYGPLRAKSLSISGFSILRLARMAPERARQLIDDVVGLAADGLGLPAPTVIGWDQLKEAHLQQSQGKAVGKTVVAVGALE